MRDDANDNRRLVVGKSLPEANRDHLLTGNWDDHQECHLESDWLVIYRINKTVKVLEYVRMGSHAELFNN